MMGLTCFKNALKLPAHITLSLAVANLTCVNAVSDLTVPQINKENEKCSIIKVFLSVQTCRLYQVSEVGQSLKKEDDRG